MPIFNRAKQEELEKEKLLNHELTDLKYTSLQEALLGEISLNSNDAKITRFLFPYERVIALISFHNKIVFARDTAADLEIAPLLYWTKLKESETAAILRSPEARLNEDLFKEKFVNFSEDVEAFFRKISLNYTLTSLQSLFEDISSYISVETAIYPSTEAIVKFLSEENGLPITSIDSILAKRKDMTHKIEQLIGIDVPYSSVVLRNELFGFTEFESEEEKMVYAASEADATLQDIEDIARGFSWIDILKSVYKLQSKEIIRVEFPDEKEELPEVFEIQKPYEKIFRLTESLDSDLSELVEKVFQISSDKDLAVSLAKNNDLLEDRIFEIENTLIKKLKAENYHSFLELDPEIQDSIRVLVLDRTEANQKRKLILEKIDSLLIDDPEDNLDAKLKNTISLKLDGISAAVDEIPELEVETDKNSFHIPEDEPDFNFNDARLVEDEDGNLSVEEIEDVEEEEELEDALALEEIVDLANSVHHISEEEVAPVPFEIDFDSLEKHLRKLSEEKPAFRSTAI